MQIEKHSWQGQLVGVQPRIRMLRSFDQRQHNYSGYILRVDGGINNQSRVFTIAIGKAAQIKHQFRVGDQVSGKSVPVTNTQTEVAEFYKTSQLALLSRVSGLDAKPPPWQHPPAELSVYRERGHRRLSASAYNTHCLACCWGCLMPVEMTIDQWNSGQRQYRTETWCYGPKSCHLYKAGAQRKVPGRNGMVWEEPDWVDKEETAWRGDDE